MAKTWRMRGGNHENNVGRGFGQYGGLASVVLRSACHSSCRGCRKRLKEGGMPGRVKEGEARTRRRPLDQTVCARMKTMACTGPTSLSSAPSTA